MRIYVDERAEQQGDQAPVLYIETHGGALVALRDTVEPEVEPVWQLPRHATELPFPEPMAQWCWEQIENVPMAKKTREALRVALNLEES